MIRASASLHIPVTTIFDPLIPVQLAGLVFVFSVAWWLGRSEAKRLGFTADREPKLAVARKLEESQRLLRRPDRVGWNLGLTLLLIAGMIAAKLDPVAVFMVGVVVALQMNYPNLKMQRERIDAHSPAALMMAGIILAAGAFTGIMKDSGMLDAMAKSAVAFAPSGAARHLPIALGLISMPLSVLFDPDSFYFGVLPVLSQTATKFGVQPVQMAQAALLGLHTTGFPVSPLTPAPFLLVGLTGIEFREHQKFAFPFLLGASVVMTVVSVVFRILPL